MVAAWSQDAFAEIAVGAEADIGAGIGGNVAVACGQHITAC